MLLSSCGTDVASSSTRSDAGATAPAIGRGLPDATGGVDTASPSWTPRRCSASGGDDRQYRDKIPTNISPVMAAPLRMLTWPAVRLHHRADLPGGELVVAEA